MARLAATVSTLMLLGVAPAAAASANAQHQVAVAGTKVTTTTNAASLRVTVRFRPSASAGLVRSGRPELTGVSPFVVVGVGGGSSPNRISGGQGVYTYNLGPVTFSIRYNRPYSNTNWSFLLSPANQAAAEGPVSEVGMAYQVNYGNFSQNASHVEPANYTFHGTMTPCHDYDLQDFTDEVTFPVAGGTSVIDIDGAIECVP